MKKSIFLIALLALIGSNSYSQSADQTTLPITQEQNRMEATIICLDAVEAPTKYNAFAKQFINTPSFPKKSAIVSQKFDLRKEINNWLITNPTLVNKILIERKKAHDILYGSHPY
jgi:hypothetical protein